MPGLLLSRSPPLSVTSLPSYTAPPLLSRLPLNLLASSTSSRPTNTRKCIVGYTDNHLPAIDETSLALHFALSSFHAVNDQYATLPYTEAFNWDEIQLPLESEREWYIVAFRSVRRQDADTTLLYQADREAHEEAVAAGGLLLYWYGAVNTARHNLATCIWQSRQYAIAANHNPKHALAAKLASATYEVYALERYILRKSKGVTRLVIEPWKGEDIGI
ncbi:MAG: hypothetical protein CYPHOPRED_002686 [Cyphobasidiales sp. Tagirdzhanova-0007]|nr:MAG: hypothetical protein CYPHOPRED_002686 [Cyphobasidiales sp. Tagirdzhanova-0007]